MKRRWIITIVVCLALLVVGLVVLLRPRIVSTNETSELYRRYENSEHITASFVKDFRVNDTVKVDVTMLEAKDSAGWDELLVNFNMKSYLKEAIDYINTTAPTVWLAPKTDYTMPKDSVLRKNDVISMWISKKTFFVFIIEDELQIKAINYHQYDEGIKKNNK
jgi:hypothetical protein